MKGRKRIEMVGQVFGRLTVVGVAREQHKDERTNGDTLWSCRCSCGATTEAYGGSLRAGHKKSCGCLRREVAKAHGHSFRDHLRRPFDSQQKDIFFKKYKLGARKRGLSWGLSKKQFDSIIEQSCFYCGSPPRELRSKYGSHSMRMSGVDRIDSGEGYSEKNCVPCCKTCNFAKNDSSLESFKSWVVRVYNHLCLEQKGKI